MNQKRKCLQHVYFVITFLDKFSVSDQYLFICPSWEKNHLFLRPIFLIKQSYCIFHTWSLPIGICIGYCRLSVCLGKSPDSTWKSWTSVLVFATHMSPQTMVFFPFAASFLKERQWEISFLLHLLFPTPITLLCVVLLDQNGVQN